jgi:hypothetical protein
MPFGGVGKFLVSSEDNDALPTVMFVRLFNLNASIWIAAHPIDLLPHEREDIERFFTECVLDRDDVRSMVANASQVRGMSSRKQRPALAFRHISNSHG